VGSSYKQILSETWPSTKEGLEMLFGWKEDLHYVVGRRNRDWPICHQAPNGDGWKHCIHVYTGAVFQLAGQDRTSHRGRNIMGWIADEGAKLDKHKLDTDVISTNRAGKRWFGNHPLLNSSICASTIPLTADGKWFSDMDKVADTDPQHHLFLRASAKQNKHNLSDDWFDVQKSIMSKYLYDIEILNIRPASVANGFYGQLDANQHYYINNNYNFIDLANKDFNPKSLTCDADGDHDPKLPLICGVDWGARINSMVVMQKLPRRINVLKNFFVKHPRILDDLVADFSAYYASRSNRTVLLYYDRSGNNRQANSKLSYAEQMQIAFKKHGWNCQLMTLHHLDPAHKDKHLVINLALKQYESSKLPIIRINKENCRELCISMENAGAIDYGNGEVKKDKSTERSKSLPQEYSTHLSDAFDIPMYNIYKPLLENRMAHVDFTVINR